MKTTSSLDFQPSNAAICCRTPFGEHRALSVERLGWSLVCLLALLQPCLSVAQTSSSTPPLGYAKIEVGGSMDNHVSVPLTQSAVAMGAVTAASPNSVTVNGAGWGPDQFMYATGSQPTSYYAEFVSGDLKGISYRVTDNTSDTLLLNTMGDNLTAHRRGVLRVGDLVRVRPFWRLGQMVGETDAGVLLQPVTALPSTNQIAVADSVLIPDNVSVGIEKAPLSEFFYIQGIGWRSRSDASSNQADFALAPGSPWTIRRYQSGNLEMLVLGGASMNQTVSFVTGGDSVNRNDAIIALTLPDPVNLDSSGLYLGGSTNNVVNASTSADQRQDQLMIYSDTQKGFDRPPDRTVIYVTGQGWVEPGSANSVAGQTIYLDPSKSYLLRKQANSPGQDWVQNPGN